MGLTLALLIRCAMLMGISWLAQMTQPLFTVFEFAASGRDLILFGGGVFLLVKTTTEIHHKIEGKEEGGPTIKKVALNAIVLQIVLIDIVFSFDSILTAVGLSNNVVIMIGAVIVAMIMMLLFSERVSDFINEHPTIKMLALAFLIVIAIMLIADAAHQHVPKEYIYSAMAFSLFVEWLNMRERKKKSDTEFHPD
jgi:predicted tellurium resistance membrane protein TerC